MLYASRSDLKYAFNFDSENVSRVKKAAESQPSVLKTASKGIQEAERFVDIRKD